MPLAEINIPLVVDLDGTLIKTDLLIETANDALVANPLSAFKIIFSLSHGRAHLKMTLADQSRIDPAFLPYNTGLIDWLRDQKSHGRSVILATASHKLLADKVAGHLGIFDDVMATEGNVNLKAARKRDALVERFAERGYDYIGNDDADFPVWHSARKAYVVSASPRLIEKVKTLSNLAEIFPAEQPSSGISILKALRPHQWIKNLLIFVPLLAAHRFAEISSVVHILIGFLIFGLTASSVYILNDLADVGNDRHHHRKRYRPFAAGNLSLLTGWLLWPVLLLVAFSLSGFLLPWAFSGVLAAYFVLTLAYSLMLKQRAMLDVLTLAGLYTMRIVAGAAAITVPLSFWLITFSVFIFLSLAFIKRYSELKMARKNGYEGNIRGRGYVHQDLELVSSMGSGAGYLSVLVLALYIQDDHTAERYAMPQVIWLACPILLYWISRAWLIAHRGQMHDDPIVYAIKDKASWVVAACFLGVFALARVPW